MKKTTLILFFTFAFCLLPFHLKAQWTQLPNLPISGTVYDMYFVNANTGWTTFNTTGTILKTTNGGQSWIQQTTPASEVWNIQFFNDTLGVALSYLSGNRLIIKTTNGGTSWNTIYTTSNVFRDITFINKDTGWVCGGDGNLAGMWITTNGGVNFQRQYTGIPGSYGTIFFLKEKGPYGYIGWVGEHPNIFRTTNSGVNWTLIYNGFTSQCGSIGDMYFTDSLNGVITRGGGCINKTTDGGYNWTTVNQFNITSGGRIAMANKQTGWLSLAEDSIIKTTNFFQTYGKQPIPVTAMTKLFAIDTSVVYGGLNQNIMIKTTNGGGNIVSVEQIGSEIPDRFYLYQNYPNPFNPTTNIKYQITKNSFVNIQVYDILGREIITLVNQKQNAGTYEVTWDASGYPSGIYFYKLIIGEGKEEYTETKKMILIK